MATASEMRAWLRAQGHEVPERGRLTAEHIRLYEDGMGPAAADDPDEDYTVPPGPPDDVEPDEPMVPESRPQTARQHRTETRQTRRRTRTDRFVGRLLGEKDEPVKGKTGGRKPKPAPRVSLDKLITRLYKRAGQMTSAVAPATGRCLEAQAAMAGIILEDVAAHTVADKMLQPVARAEEKLDKVFALMAPPLIVFALETSNPDDQIRRMMLMSFLREALSISFEVTDAYAEQIKANLERHSANESKVDELISYIFGVPQATAEEPEPEMAGAAA